MAHEIGHLASSIRSRIRCKGVDTNFSAAAGNVPQVGKGARTTVVCTQGRPALRDNVQAVYGAKLLSGLEEFSAEGDGFALAGFVSSAVKNANKTNGDRQFFYLNGRPVDLPKAVRVVNDVYRCRTLFCLRLRNPPLCRGAWQDRAGW